MAEANCRARAHTAYFSMHCTSGRTRHIYLCTAHRASLGTFRLCSAPRGILFGARTHGIFFYTRYPRESRYILFMQCTSASHVTFRLCSAPRGILFGAGAHGIFIYALHQRAHTAYFFRHSAPARITLHFSMPRPAPHHLTHQSRQSRLYRCQEYRESGCHRV